MKKLSVILLGTLTFLVSLQASAGFQVHIMDLNYGDGKSYTVLSFKHIQGQNVSVNDFNSELEEHQYRLRYEVSKFGSYGNAFANDYFPKPLKPENLEQFIVRSLDRAQKWIDQTYIDRGVIEPDTALATSLENHERLNDGRSSFILITEHQNPDRILGMIRVSHRAEGVLEKLPMELSLGLRFPRPELRSLGYSKHESHNDVTIRFGRILPFNVVPQVRPDGYGIQTGASYSYGDIAEIKNFALVPGNKRLFPILLYVAEVTGISREGQPLEGYRTPSEQWEHARRPQYWPPHTRDWSYHYNFAGVALPSTYVIESKGELLGFYKSLGFKPVDESLNEIAVESSQRARKGKLYKLAISREGYVELLKAAGSGIVNNDQWWRNTLADDKQLSLVTTQDVRTIVGDRLDPDVKGKLCIEAFK